MGSITYAIGTGMRRYLSIVLLMNLARSGGCNQGLTLGLPANGEGWQLRDQRFDGWE